MNISLRGLWIIAVVFAFALGILVRATPDLQFAGRIYPLAGSRALGYDEGFYAHYASRLAQRGLVDYPAFVNEYIEKQKVAKDTFVPPLRFLYIGATALWCRLTGTNPVEGLREVSALFSILTLGVTFCFILRMVGRGAALGVLALMACAPTQIHMAHHGLIDGFFTFFATLVLWMLWEALQISTRLSAAPVAEAPAVGGALRGSGWKPLLLRVAYAASLALLVMTKENAAFVYIAVLGILLVNRWLRFGTVDRPLVLATLLGPALGVLILIALAGSLETFFTSYLLWMARSSGLAWAIHTQGGPWNRYLIDLMIVSPIVLSLAIGTVFQLRPGNPCHRPQFYLFVFVAVSYLIMCNIKDGMNLRFANMWDAPLRLLAFTQLSILAGRLDRLELFGIKRPGIWLAVGVAALCGVELRQYWIIGIHFGGLYELVTEILLRAVNLLK